MGEALERQIVGCVWFEEGNGKNGVKGLSWGREINSEGKAMRRSNNTKDVWKKPISNHTIFIHLKLYKMCISVYL